VLSADHAILLKDQRNFNIMSADGSPSTIWYESNVDEIVARLEWAYQNREAIRKIGESGAGFISRFTWDRAAGEFHKLLKGSPSPQRSTRRWL
jgi:hypothetical protein